MALRLVIIGGLIVLLSSQHGPMASQATRVADGIERQEDRQQEAQRIWEQAIVAKGGRERLDAVQNLVISTIGNYTAGSGKANTVRTEALFVLPNKVWIWSDYRSDVFGLTVEMLNFDSNTRYFINSDNPTPRPLAIPSNEKSEARIHGILSYLLETKWLKPVLIRVSTARIGRRSVDVVQTTVGDKRVDFALDRETHLPMRVSYYHTRGGESVLDVAEDLSDYTETSGIKVPQSRRVGDSLDKVRIQINVAYNQDIFSKPPSIAAGPAAWRPKINR
jgi:hypothetical protein